MAKYCSSCGKEIVEGMKFCPSCGGKTVVYDAPIPVQSQIVQTPAKIKDPGIAVVLSFFIPGVGHIYVGKIGEGIFFLVSGIVTTIVGFIYPSYWVVYLIIWVLAMYNAYAWAEKINRGEIKV